MLVVHVGVYELRGEMGDGTLVIRRAFSTDRESVDC
jgi:hypothetical protein